VNYGSTAHPALFRRTFEELANRPFQVLLATCGQVDPADFPSPPNFVVEKFLPVSKVLEASDLAVYHGGAGTFQQSVRAGVPGVVIATHWDQEWAGLLTERHGLGVFLTMPEVLASPGLLRGAVERVLGRLSGHRENARRLRNEILAYDGPRSAADHIEAFAKSLAPRGQTRLT
jgi:UDP:flavonoid glycosyltransferase YjiC (YdhE family)